MKWILEFLFPLYCIGCSKRGWFVCPPCLAVRRQAHHPRVLTLLDYNDPLVRPMMLRMKSFPDYTTGRYCAQYWSEYLIEYLSELASYGYRYDRIALVPIPPRSERMRTYGFNQALFLAESLMTYLPKSYIADVLVRTKTTRKQALLGKS